MARVIRRAELRPFYGRDPELTRLADLAAGRTPLLTILGPGGMGKTTLVRRYSLQAAEAGQQVVWVELEATSSVEGLAGAILAAVLGPGPAPEEPSESRVARALAEAGELLLILDNLEQLLPGAARPIAAWLEAAPELQIWVTSRQALRISYETVLELLPLDAEHGGEALFLARLQNGRPAEAWTDQDREAIRRIVRAVDGIPLAIELAAARARTLGIPALADQLERDVMALGSGPLDAAPRHRSLEAAIEGTLRTLDSTTRIVLGMAARFRGPVTVTALAAALERPEPEVTTAVETLRDCSLLRGVALGRHGMYGPIQRYVHTLDLDREVPNARARYEAQVLKLVRSGDVRVEDLLAIVEGHTDDAASLGRALEAAASLPLRELLPAAGSPLETRLRNTLQAAGEEVPAPLRALGHWSLGDLEWFRDRYPAAAWEAEQTLALIDPGSEPHLAQKAGLLMGRAHFGAGRFAEAEAALAPALSLATQRSDRRGQAELLQCIAAVRQSLGFHAEAEADLLLALELARSSQSPDVAAHVEASLGTLFVDQGRLRAAELRLLRAETLAIEARQTRTLPITQAYLALTYLELGQLESAAQKVHLALEGVTQSGDEHLRSVISAFAGAIAASQDRLAEAELHFSDVPAGRHQAGAWAEVRCALQGHLHLARARAAPDLRQASLEMVQAERCLPQVDGAAHRASDDLRIVARILDRALKRQRSAPQPPAPSPHTPGALWLGPDLGWFSLSGGPRVDLSRRPLLRGLLAVLTERHHRSRGAVTTLPELAARAWPHEVYRPEIHSNRLHVALSTLRRLGLRGILDRHQDGYRLEPTVELHHYGPNA